MYPKPNEYAQFAKSIDGRSAVVFTSVPSHCLIIYRNRAQAEKVVGILVKFIIQPARA